MLLMRKLRKNTSAERREDDHPHQRAAEQRLAERRQASTLPPASLNDCGIGEPGGDAGEHQADCHVVVDAEHMGPEALSIAPTAPRATDVPYRAGWLS